MPRFVTYLLLSFVAVSSTAFGQIRFWLSPESLPPGSPVPVAGSTVEMNQPINASGMIHLWTRPEPGEALANFSLNVVSSSDTVLQFDGVQIHNDMLGDANRFEFLFDSNNGLDATDQVPCFVDFDADIPTHALWGLRGFSVSDSGGTGIAATSTSEDPNYDASAQTWLLATIRFTPLTLGATELSLQVGEIGISQAGEQSGELLVSFGNPNDGPLNAKTDRCVSSDTSEATVHIVEPILGDFNNNGLLDAGDIDLLSIEVSRAANAVGFSLDGDPQVVQADRVFWVETLKGTFFGDANLDGDVDFDDFIDLSTNFAQPGGWAQGDFDGNRLVDFDDFIELSANFGSTSAAEAVSVPEPTCPWPALWSLLAGWTLLCRAYRANLNSTART